MLPLPSLRGSSRAIALCAVAIALLFALPSLARPDMAQAQYCGSSGFSVAGSSSSCGSYGGFGGYGGCSTLGSVGCGGYGSGCGAFQSSCSGNYGSGCGAFQSSCSGSYGSSFGSYGGLGCSGAFGSCPSGIGGGPSCVGIQLTAGETCSNGQVSCPPTATGQQTTCTAGGYGPQNSSSCQGQSCQSYNPNCQPNVSSSLCPGGYQATVPTNGLNAAALGSNPVIGENYGSGSNSAAGGGSGGVSANLVSCGSFGQVPSGSCPNGSGSGGATSTNLSLGGSASGLSIVYPSGWNIIAGPSGTSFGSASGSIYTLQSGDSGYETGTLGSAMKAGNGYWYYSSGAQATLPGAPGASATVQLPAGQWVLIGNPGSTVATVSGADQVLAYNPMSGSYTQTTQLQPGQGAWAMSNAGGTATITGQ